MAFARDSGRRTSSWASACPVNRCRVPAVLRTPPARTASALSPAAAATIALADDVVAGLKRESPELGTILGLPDAQHALVQDNSIEGRARREGEEDAWHKRR